MMPPTLCELRAKIRSGTLPSDACAVTWFGPGTGRLCRACDLPVRSDEIEVECDLPSGEKGVRFHRDCYDAWDRALSVL
jgi:hypothetical protein